MRILTLVHTCKRYEQTRAKIVLSSWANDLEDFFFVCDSPDFTLGRHQNFGPYPHGWTYHPEVLIRMFDFFLSASFDAIDWLFIVDDDTYCFHGRLTRYLEQLDPSQPLMLGDFLNWPKFRAGHLSNYRSWLGGGSGIVLSKPAVEELQGYIRARNRSLLRLPKYENHDVWLHKLIEKDGTHEIHRIHIPGFHQFGAPELLEERKASGHSLISVHLNGDMDLMSQFHCFAKESE